MKKFTYDMAYQIETPLLILSTTWHKHLGTITNVPDGLNAVFNMNSVDEISFDVYKDWDNQTCILWDEIVSFRYVYIPDHNAYYEIYVSIDDTDNTIKHVNGKAAGEVELSNRKLNDFHCNDEVDILANDYDANMPTVLYRPILPTDTEEMAEKKKRASLLHRVLADKCPDWSIGHVDETIASIQRTFTADNTAIYDFLTNTVAKEINCLFTFDSVDRTVNAYDLYNKCKQCGYRTDKIDKCPKCGNTKFIEGYGNRTSIFLNTENYAKEINLSGNTDNVKNCLRLTAGDEATTAAVKNINPNGSRYIYHFSDAMLHDMPTELVNRIHEYDALYKSLETTYATLTQQWYEYIDNIGKLEHSMMPETPIPGETTAQEQLDILIDAYTRSGNPETVSVNEISNTVPTLLVASNGVEGYSRVLIDPRYTVTVEGESLSAYDEQKETRTWTGKITVYSLGATDKEKQDDTEGNVIATSSSITVTIIGGTDNYEQFLNQKIQKTLDRTDYGLMTLFKIENDAEFIHELTKYSESRLLSFNNEYKAVCETLSKMEIKKGCEKYFGIDLYAEMYEPYFKRLGYIEAEVNKRGEQITEEKKLRDAVGVQREDIQEQLDFPTFLGDELFHIFCMYRKEGDYTNSNYISTDLTSAQLVEKAKEYFEVAQDEVIKASEIELTISETLNNLLNIKEFADYKDGFDIGDWIVTEVDESIYKMRLISVNYTYSSPESISFTFSNVDRMISIADDVNKILSTSQSMAGSYNTVAHQAKQGDEANADVTEMQEDGVDASKYNILAGANSRMVIDEHGMLFKDYDDIKGVDSPEQMRMNGNVMEFTDDYWKTVKAAIGKIHYTLNGKNETRYGVNAETLIAGLMIAGQMYSENWSDDGTGVYNGTHIDLNSGEFVIGGNGVEGGYGIKFDGDTIQLGNNIDLVNSSGNTVTITEIADMDAVLKTKQDKLIAGRNITIEDNVISAEGGGSGEQVELTQEEYDNLPDTKLSDDIEYFITDANGSGGGSGIGGGNINQYGTTPPANRNGKNGDMYALYDATTSTITTLYMKINGSWMPFVPPSSGGGGSVIRQLNITDVIQTTNTMSAEGGVDDADE